LEPFLPVWYLRGVYVSFWASRGIELVSITDTAERTETGVGPELVLVPGALISDFGDGDSDPLPGKVMFHLVPK
jgi:hypothetical protein